MKLRSIKEAGKLRGKRVLLRLGLNAAIKNGKVMGGFRLQKVIPTIVFLKKKGAKVIIMGHIGRERTQSLKPVADYVSKMTKIRFVPDLHDKNLPDIIANMKEGSALMLENLRSDLGEVKNTAAFARYLASLGDIYVNDAFSASHRKHASIVSLPKLLPGYAGLHFEEEIKHLSLVKKPSRPFLFILGGAKFSTKMPLMKKFFRIADYVFIGGALANTFFKEQGFETGRSLADEDDFNLGTLLRSKKLVLPSDVVVKNRRSVFVKKPQEVAVDDTITDAGPETIKELKRLVSLSKFVLYNGPLGNYEEGFEKGTAELLRVIAKSRAITVVGGGDTLTLVSALKLHNKFTFVSTGGGAMLDFLAEGTLPGIEALQKSAKRFI
ncbi:MAG: hypothetical protein BMS9Abin13_183 [Patescibacteria group bacterium]|nr:MAG: hypothetical protein BMS9Abin13_183 [Patescibacteria group bacterium]